MACPFSYKLARYLNRLWIYPFSMPNFIHLIIEEHFYIILERLRIIFVNT
jgi:hypothetical protein